MSFFKKTGRWSVIVVGSIFVFILVFIVFPFYYFFEINPAIKAVTYEDFVIKEVPLHPQGRLINKGMRREEILPSYLFEADYAIDHSTPTSNVIEYYTFEMEKRGWTRKPVYFQVGYIVYRIAFEKGKEHIVFGFECAPQSDSNTNNINCVKSKPQNPLILKVEYQNHLSIFQRIPDYIRIITTKK